MVTFIILMGISAFIIYLFQQELKKGYSFIGRNASLKSRNLPAPQAYRDVLGEYIQTTESLREGQVRTTFF